MKAFTKHRPVYGSKPFYAIYFLIYILEFSDYPRIRIKQLISIITGKLYVFPNENFPADYELYLTSLFTPNAY